MLLTGPSQVSGETHSANDDAEDPLERHEPGEQPIGMAVDVVLVGREQLVGAARDRAGMVERHGGHLPGHDFADANSEHPNTFVVRCRVSS